MEDCYVKHWDGFNGGVWREEVDVRDFIQKNYKPYEGDDSFLSEATERTKKLWEKVMELMKEEHKKGHWVLKLTKLFFLILRINLN